MHQDYSVISNPGAARTQETRYTALYFDIFCQTVLMMDLRIFQMFQKQLRFHIMPEIITWVKFFPRK